MRPMFSSDAIRERDRFRCWREVSRARLPPFMMWQTNDQPFTARWEAGQFGDLGVSRTEFSSHGMETGVDPRSKPERTDRLVTAIRLKGRASCRQHDRIAKQKAGDLVVFDNSAPLLLDFPEPVSSLRLEIPREQLERLLGPVRLYAALNIDGSLPGATLARGFFSQLIAVHEDMSPDMVDRMTRIGVSLIVASVAERMAQETPKAIQGTVLVQRAKAYVEDNLGDANLDPPALAAAVGISLRRLQVLFNERGRHISDWIWLRRLEVAAARLSDPGIAHQSIGTISYGCGFSNQAHFSRRFRDHFTVTPREYRHAALSGSAQAA